MRGMLGTMAAGWALGIMMAATATATAAGAGDEVREVEADKVPAAVAKAAEKAAPGVKMKRRFRVKADDRSGYVLEGIDPRKRPVVVSVADSGEVESVETIISLEEIPRPTRDLALSHLNGRKYTRIKASGPTLGRVRTYDFEGPDDQGQLLGSILSIAVK